MTVELRPLAPADGESFMAFVRGLSMQSRLHRFLAPLRELAPAVADALTHPDQRRHVALVATEDGRIVGEGRYVTFEDGTRAEFAIAVTDERQRQGIGARLMRALIGAARRAGLKTLQGEVLRTNVAMLRFVRHAGFRLQPCCDATLVTAVHELEPAVHVA